jgi:acyl carrier protein
MVAAVNVTDAARLAELLQSVASALPPLRGVFHSAMVLDDDLIDRLDAARFRVPMSAKVLGAWNLHAQSLDLPLDMFVLYSSMVAVLGNLGQAGYASANAYLDGLARHRRAMGLPALSINWGSLAEVGFVAQNPAISRHLERTGMFPIAASRALDVMGSLLGSDRAGIGVANLDWSVWEHAVPALAARPRFTEVLVPRDDNEGAAESESPRALIAAIRKAATEDRISLAADILREVIAKVLRLPASKLDVDQNLNQLGIDSLMAVELQTLIAEKTGAHFSPMDFMAGPSIMTMAKKLIEKLFPGEDVDSAGGATEIHVDYIPPSRIDYAASPVDQSLAGQPAQSSRGLSIPDIDGLSEIELDELLSRITNQETHL